MLLFVLLLIGGCISPPPESQPPVSETPTPSDEPISLDVEPVIDYYSLGGYTGKAGAGFYVISGDAGEVKKTLNEIVVHGTPPKTTFTSSDNMNLVVFRGVFGTGGHGIQIDRVEKAGKTFVVHATYTDPGRGMMVTQAFTQPTAIIPLGTLPEDSYRAMLNVTKVVEGEEEEEKDTVLDESWGQVGIAFEIVGIKTSRVSLPTQVPSAPKQFYIESGKSKQFIYLGHNITIDYISAYPIQMIGVVINGIEKTFQKELTENPRGIYWKEGNLSFALKPVMWEMRDGQRIPFYEKTWNTSEIYIEIITTGV